MVKEIGEKLVNYSSNQDSLFSLVILIRNQQNPQLEISVKSSFKENN